MAIEIKENIALAPYTIYKIGGPARFFVETKTSDDVRDAVAFAKEKNLPFFILGAGSNMLVSDDGFSGVVIRMAGNEVRVEDDRLVCDAGTMMARAVLAAGQAGLAGFAWGIGIPGTIGGSVRGNAGCFGGEMSKIVERIQLLEFSIFNFQFPKKPQTSNPEFKIQELNNRECQFGYRDSIFKKHPEWIILSATLKLKRGDTASVRQEIQRISKERLTKQDIGTKSCGCIFKNMPWGRDDTDKTILLKKFPELEQFSNQSHIPSSYLIDHAGLKGTRVGKAIISPKHANFFVNEGANGSVGATAHDIRALIELAKNGVKNHFGILLDEEIQYVGF